ncbi:hypothetical protein [Archaeoglobus sp.]
MFELCVPPDKLLDVAIIFLFLGFVSGYATGVVAAYIALKKKGRLNEK